MRDNTRNGTGENTSPRQISNTVSLTQLSESWTNLNVIPLAHGPNVPRAVAFFPKSTKLQQPMRNSSIILTGPLSGRVNTPMGLTHSAITIPAPAHRVSQVNVAAIFPV